MLSKLNNNELDVKIKSLAQKERELLHEVLLHISEADRRRQINSVSTNDLRQN